MLCRNIKYSVFMLAAVFFYRSQAQLLIPMNEHHNQVFVGPAYTQSFGNISYGFNHWRYFKFIKRELVGILDFSSPVSTKYYTRFVFRKGFQFDVYKKRNLKFPLAVITSSVRKHLHLFNLHDIITDFYFLPGIYHKKYTLAGEFNLKVLWRQKALYNADYYKQADVTPPPNANANRVNISVGVVLAYNISRFTLLFRGGYQQVTDVEFTKAPFYVFGALCCNFNFKKHQSSAETRQN